MRSPEEIPQISDALWQKYQELWGVDNFDAREKFAQFEALSNDVIEDIFSNKGNLGILSALEANENLPSEIAQGMLDFAYAISGCEDSDLNIHRGLASDASLSPELLQMLAESDNEEVAEIAQEMLGSRKE